MIPNTFAHFSLKQEPLLNGKSIYNEFLNDSPAHPSLSIKVFLNLLGQGVINESGVLDTCLAV